MNAAKLEFQTGHAGYRIIINEPGIGKQDDIASILYGHVEF